MLTQDNQGLQAKVNMINKLGLGDPESPVKKSMTAAIENLEKKKLEKQMLESANKMAESSRELQMNKEYLDKAERYYQTEEFQRNQKVIAENKAVVNLINSQLKTTKEIGEKGLDNVKLGVDVQQQMIQRMADPVFRSNAKEAMSVVEKDEEADAKKELVKRLKPLVHQFHEKYAPLNNSMDRFVYQTTGNRGYTYGFLGESSTDKLKLEEIEQTWRSYVKWIQDTFVVNIAKGAKPPTQEEINAGGFLRGPNHSPNSMKADSLGRRYEVINVYQDFRDAMV